MQDTGEVTLKGRRMIRVSKPRKLEVRGNSTLLPVRKRRKNPSERRMAAWFVVESR